MHKAEREKLKRDHLNELFLELDHSLEQSRQNNGKACILGDATRLLPDLIAQVESLRKENATLVSESHYVSMEKNELKDEKRVLEADIERLQSKLQQGLQSDLVLHNLPHSASTALSIQHPLAVTRPTLMAPPHQELQLNHELEATWKPKSHSRVKRPQARYPTPFDSWPLELLTRHPQGANGTTNDAVGNSSNRA
ncbi:hypothetical protein J5N97_017233 [Dioscorea zingiberensis]|uniref:BHLH domain-containing protein n=1 Tax=Dioscorea zingiberensis TaxID=325984 RepID=A0A9D5CKV3_9LILI|nr:hypothetical protein J5N97_017233 [Dioscorea zingiberensis]